MKKRNYLTILIVSLAFLGLVSTPVMAADDKVSISGYAEFGLAVAQTDIGGVEASASDMGITLLELAFDAKASELVKVHALLYYDNTLLDGEGGSDVVWDEGYVTIGDAEKYLIAGLMYAPFGAQQTHFPGDPAIAVPLTLLFGEAQEEAVAVGVSKDGLTATLYAFQGEWDGDHISSYGLDVNYKMEEKLTVGASYISNVCETDFLEAALVATPPTDDYAGAAVYLHFGVADFFVAAEYMTALDEIADAGNIEPSVMNIEAGIDLYAAGKNLEVVVKYATSHDVAGLDLPETRYGVCANLELLDHTTLSLAYLTDEDYAGDTTDTMVALLGVEF